MRKIAIIFLSVSLNMCFGCSKEPSHRDSFFEYPQKYVWLGNKKNNFQLRTFLWGPGVYNVIKRQSPGYENFFVVFILKAND